jgi:hypothetical protein
VRCESRRALLLSGYGPDRNRSSGPPVTGQAIAGRRPLGARRPLATLGAVLGLLVYMASLGAAIPRPGPGTALDRGPSVAVARPRQVDADVAAADRPCAWSAAPALAPAGAPSVLAPDATGCAVPGEGASRGAGGLSDPGRPRSPPASPRLSAAR